MLLIFILRKSGLAKIDYFFQNVLIMPFVSHKVHFKISKIMGRGSLNQPDDSLQLYSSLCFSHCF